MHTFSLIVHRSFVFILLVSSLLLPAIAFAQVNHPVAEWLESYRLSNDFSEVNLLSVSHERSELPAIIHHGTPLNISQTALSQLFTNAQPTLTLQVPSNHVATISLELVKVEITAPEFTLGTLGDGAHDNVAYQPGIHYRGIVRGNPASIATLSVYSDGIVGMFSDESGTYQIGKLEDGSGDYALYRTQDMSVQSPFTCFSDENSLIPDDQPVVTEDRGVGCKTVNVYFECDYKLYQDKGSNATSVTNYVTAFFNQTAALYAVENIGIAISQIYVWTSTDPYASMTSTSAVLTAFRATRSTNHNGNLAHFLSSRSLGGGIAFLDVICVKEYAHGVSGIYTTFQNVPTFSWTVEVVTHELGHNLGSWHTQSCNWSGGALDNCYGVEGSCAPGPTPTNGGTIMSYCHLTNIGINFANGFGIQPGNRIRDKVLAASCLSQTGTAPSNLTTTNISGTSATLNWGAVAGATNYTIQYKLNTATNWTAAGPTTASSYTVSSLAANTAYNWQVKTDCSSFSAASNFTTTASGSGGNGTCTAPTSLSVTGIATTSATLNWGAVSGAINYSLQYRTNGAANWTTIGTTTATTYNVAGLTVGTAYNWQVKASCSTYTAGPNFTTTTVGGGNCAPPTGLTTTGLSTNSVILVWAAVSGATSYTIQYKPSTTSSWITAGTATTSAFNLGGLTAGVTYNWQVKASCSVYSATALFSTTGGGSGVCNAPNSLSTMYSGSNASLSWNAVAGASSYTLQYRPTTANYWITTNALAVTNYTLSGLSANTTYNWRVKASCSGYSAVALFSTGSGGSTCAIPVNLTNNSVSATSAVISWGAVSGATNYVLQLKLASSANYSTLGTVSSNIVTLSGLQSSTAYTWRVKANCSDYSVGMGLNTPAFFIDQKESAALIRVAVPEVSLVMYPNPATDLLNLDFTGILPVGAQLLVTDATGRIVVSEAMLEPRRTLDISNLPGGFYFLSLFNQKERLAMQKFVKVK